jgi:hypothetical protein
MKSERGREREGEMIEG